MRTTTHRRSAALIAAAVTALVALSACSAPTPASPSSTSAASDAVLKFATLLPASWDPAKSTCGCDISVTSLVYSSLTRPDNQGKAVPDLATDWEYAKDGKSVTFTLRPGLTFSDGSALDADAVVKHFVRTKTASFSTLAAQLATVDSVIADSPTKVTFHLNRVDYTIPILVSARVGLIESPKANPDALTSAPVGSGPYIVTENVAGAHVTLKKNPAYWNAKDYKIAGFTLLAQGDKSTVVSAIASGAVDVSEINADQIPAAKAAGLKVQEIETQNEQFFNVNVRNGALTDPKVLEAVRYSIDRQAYADSVLGGKATPDVQAFPKGYVGFDPTLGDPWPYSVAKAKKILADAGYKPGELSITISSKATIPGAAEFLQESLKKIGINSTIKTVVNWQQETYVNQNFEIIGDGHVGRESPIQLLDALYGANGLLNGSRAATPEFNAALDAVRATPQDDPSYAKVLQKATKVATVSGSDIILAGYPRIVARAATVSALPAARFTYRWEGVTIHE